MGLKKVPREIGCAETKDSKGVEVRSLCELNEEGRGRQLSHDPAAHPKYKEGAVIMISHGTECSPRIQYPRAPMIFNHPPRAQPCSDP